MTLFKSLSLTPFLTLYIVLPYFIFPARIILLHNLDWFQSQCEIRKRGNNCIRASEDPDCWKRYFGNHLFPLSATTLMYTRPRGAPSFDSSCNIIIIIILIGIVMYHYFGGVFRNWKFNLRSVSRFEEKHTTSLLLKNILLCAFISVMMPMIGVTIEICVLTRLVCRKGVVLSGKKKGSKWPTDLSTSPQILNLLNHISLCIYPYRIWRGILEVI